MSFYMPDLVVESILREGFLKLKRKPELIDEIFSSLLNTYVDKKYGQKEINRIKEVILKRDWSFVHSFGEVEANLPCVSIQLGSESEDRSIAHLEDFEGEETEQFTDQEDIDNLTVLSGILPNSYDFTNGILYIPNSVNLTNVHKNLIYVDAVGNEFQILGGIDNTNGSKQFLVDPQSEVDISDVGYIKSSIDYRQFAIRGIHDEVQLLLGIHAQDALVTKYIYVLVKYLLLARKKTLIERNFITSSYQGSDFTRNLKYEGDVVYTRYLTLTGKVQQTWDSDQAEIFDNIEVITKVAKDKATTEDLDRQDMSVQVGETDQE